MNEVLCWSDTSISISYYLLFVSIVENIAALQTESMHLSIGSKRYDSRFVTAIRFRKTTQNRMVLYFFGANTNCATHFDCAGSITFRFIILCFSAVFNSFALEITRMSLEWSGLV